MSKGVQIAIGALLVFGLLGWYGYSNLESASTFQYYQTLDEFLASNGSGDNMLGKSLRVHGYVAPGSIDRNVQAKQVTFAVQNDPPHKTTGDVTTFPILYQSLETPDMFRDGADVVVEGKLAKRDDRTVFLADNVLAKCPSKFQANAEVPQREAASL